jgi:ribosomal protein S18 acetylase RimI-like enzyme
VPRLTDLATIRTLLDRDRAWAAYAIGDLAPGLVENCDWHASSGTRPALVLLYRGFDRPIAFAMGEPEDLRPLFAELSAPTISLHLQPHALEAASDLYAPTFTRDMRRMVLRPEKFVACPSPDVTPIGEEHLPAVQALYQDGHERGEGPTFFDAGMLRQRTFRGVWEQGALVSIAGTHQFSPDLGICTIGNVYTRSDRRGRGLAAVVTSAVVRHALQRGATTIVLNVAYDNGPAQRLYERLGFEVYCRFVEGEATRRSQA